MEEMLPATSERCWAFALLRVLTGLDFFGHGFARIFTGSHLSAFAEGMVKSMATTPLPPALVLATGYVVPCVELLAGVLLLLDFGVQIALFITFTLMFVLMFGITLKQDWNVAGQQLQYGLVLAVLLFGRAHYDRSWAALFRRGEQAGSARRG